MYIFKNLMKNHVSLVTYAMTHWFWVDTRLDRAGVIEYIRK